VCGFGQSAVEGLGLDKIEASFAYLTHGEIPSHAKPETQKAVRATVILETGRDLPQAKQRLLKHGLRVHNCGKAAEAGTEHGLRTSHPLAESRGITGDDRWDESV
jgi:hypothetical protein